MPSQPQAVGGDSTYLVLPRAHEVRRGEGLGQTLRPRVEKRFLLMRKSLLADKPHANDVLFPPMPVELLLKSVDDQRAATWELQMSSSFEF
jgi:hypothetical protein